MFNNISCIGVNQLGLSDGFWQNLKLHAKNINSVSDLESLNSSQGDVYQAEVLIVSPFVSLPKFWFSNFPSLLHVIVLGTDTGRVMPALIGNDIQVHNLSCYCTRSVAEFALASLLKKTRGLDPLRDNGTHEQNENPILDLTEISAGILGCGRIGSLLGNMLWSLGTKVTSFDLIHEKTLENQGAPSIEDLFSVNDFIFVLIPLNFQNEKLISESLLSRTRKGSTIINISPIDVYNLKDLKKSLSSGHINFISHQSHGKQGSFDSLCDEPNATIYKPVAHASKAALKQREEDCLNILIKIRADSITSNTYYLEETLH